jgi:membrane-associated protease RseP (regulator of RpoE activity)
VIETIAMKRTLALCLMLPGLSLSSGALLAAPPASTASTTESDAAVQQQMAALQARMNALAGRMAALSAKLGDEANASTLHYFADRKRGMLGIAASAEDHGLHVNAVTPGGPAERAGLKAGDTITTVDGKPVGSFDAPSETALRTAEAGKPVRLGVTRDGKTLHVDVTPERMQPGDWQATVRAAQRAAEQATASIQSQEFQQNIQQSIDSAMKSASAALDRATIARESAAAAREGAAAAREAAVKAREHAHRWILFTSPWWGLNLTPLNPDLGRYFGTDKGVLVLSRSDEQFPELQPGDVITGIDGKPVAQPEDVQRALRGATGEQQVRMAVRRHGKTLGLDRKVPARWNLLPPPPPPLPPAPPVPPNAPKVAAPPAPPVAPAPPSSSQA